MSPKKSDLEAAFDTQLKRLAQEIPPPKPNYKFHPDRRWEVDRAWPDYKVAVEIEGGGHGYPVICHNCNCRVRAKKKDGSPGRELRIGGWHARHDRFLSDMEKYNSLESMGWILLRFTNDDINGDPFKMVNLIRVSLHNRRGRIKLIEGLTNRELEVLYLIAAGFKTQDIALRLGVGMNGIRSYVSDLCEKLVAPNRAAAVARAFAWGILDVDQVPWAEEME